MLGVDELFIWVLGVGVMGGDELCEGVLITIILGLDNDFEMVDFCCYLLFDVIAFGVY